MSYTHTTFYRFNTALNGLKTGLYRRIHDSVLSGVETTRET